MGSDNPWRISGTRGGPLQEEIVKYTESNKSGTVSFAPEGSPSSG